jgi:hypothetical protein
MVGWVGALAPGTEDNWDICKRRNLWGTNARSGGGVRRGDDLFIWWSGHGWLAHCRATTSARAVRGVEEVPWPDPRQYKYLFDIEVLHEAAPAIWMTGRELLEVTGLHTVRLGQFPKLPDPEVVDRLRALFTRR